MTLYELHRNDPATPNKDPKVGVKYDGGKLRYDLVPPDAFQEVVRAFTVGALKYGDRNWEAGMDWSRYFAAMQRHAWAWQNGEDLDKENGQHHLASVVFCALALLTYSIRGVGTDDRVNRNLTSPH